MNAVASKPVEVDVGDNLDITDPVRQEEPSKKGSKRRRLKVNDDLQIPIEKRSKNTEVEDMQRHILKEDKVGVDREIQNKGNRRSIHTANDALEKTLKIKDENIENENTTMESGRKSDLNRSQDEKNNFDHEKNRGKRKDKENDEIVGSKIRKRNILCETSKNNVIAINLDKRTNTNKKLVHQKCVKCDYSTPKLSDLLKHMKGVHKGFRLRCQRCEYSTADASNLNRHVRLKHEKSSIHPCDQCEYSATTLHNLKSHKKVQHEVAAYFPCDECDFVTTAADYLKRHKDRIHMRENSFGCDACDDVYSQYSELKEHKNRIHSVSIYPCDQCDYAATHKSHLKEHIVRKHESGRHPCDMCSYSAKISSDLKKHKKRKHFKC